MRSRGFTMVELLIAMVIVALLLLLAVPTFAEFMRNARIRNTADSIAGGIRLAQTEAVRRNQNVEFIVDPAAGWTIRDPLTPAVLHAEAFTDAAGQLVVDPSPAGAVKLTYSPIGQFVTGTNPDDGSDVMTSVAVRHATAVARPLRVITEPWGQGVRVCDNDAAVHASLRCPAGVP
jgi:type IV fimbrial biogenesis protein FimT